jgi:hypothetical protein
MPVNALEETLSYISSIQLKPEQRKSIIKLLRGNLVPRAWKSPGNEVGYVVKTPLVIAFFLRGTGSAHVRLTVSYS